MTPAPALSRDNRRGIALVIVLSLMAALMILAVSFAVSMRTEHKAAKMSGTQIQAIQMCYYGLAQALEHIESDARSSTWWPATAGPSAPPIGGSIPPGWYYPGWSNHCLHSGMRPDAKGDIATWFPDDRAIRFVPQALFGPSGTVHTLNNETNRIVCPGRTVRFVDVDAPTANGRTVGRYAYIVVDCSGMVDVNGNHELEANRGRTQPRGLGTNVCEIAFTNALEPVLRTTGATNIHNARVGYGGYRHQRFGRVESLEDLRTIAYGGFADLNNAPFRTFSDPGPNSSNNVNYPRILTTYTRYPQGNGFLGASQFDLSGTAAEIGANSGALVSHLQGRLGMSSDRATWFTRNLIDYLDTDFVPGGINGGVSPTGPNADSICTEPVPMLSRLDFRTYYTSPSNLVVESYVETFFPFLFSSNAAAIPQLTFNFKYELVGGTFTPGSASVSSNVPSKDSWVRTTPGASPDQLTAHFSFPFGARGWTNAHRSLGSTHSMPTGLRITELSLTLPGGNTVVDRIRPPIDFTASEILPPSNLTPEKYMVRYDVVDPRINWILRGANAHWKTTTAFGPTVSRIGNLPQRLTNAVPFEKGEWVMYAGNDNKLWSLGELGYLLHDSLRPWRTVSFFCETQNDTNDYINVWEHFTLNPKRTRYGLVNVSSRITNALATAFHGCPFDAAPGIPAKAGQDLRLSSTGALAIAREIINNRPGQGYTNLAALGGTSVNMMGLPGLVSILSVPWMRNNSWIGRENLLRSTEGLLGIRNNTFIVLVLGQGATKLDDPESTTPVVRRTAGHRAIALVWRDPLAPPGTPKHFVRWIRWQDDWVGDVSDQF